MIPTTIKPDQLAAVPEAGQLRSYQVEAVAATETYLATREGNPCVVLPTGAGKSHVIAALARNAVERGERVLVLAHVKELLQQNHAKIGAADRSLDVGLYSAGLGRRDVDGAVVVAGIQSVFRRAEEIGSVGLIIIDEAHLIPPDGEGRYRTLLADYQTINPDVRVVGLTATPYRMRTGWLAGDGELLTEVVCETSIRSCIDDGYLSPLVSKAGIAQPDFGRLHLRGGEFRDDEISALMESVVTQACAEIVSLTADRRGCLVFAAGVKHGQLVTEELRRLRAAAEFVCGETPKAERDRLVADFKSRRLQYLVNVNVLTTGFDAPHVDCIAMLRPTMSPGLYYQMVGRGLRIAEGKRDCLVLDYAGNVRRHGPIDTIEPEAKPTKRGNAPVKSCPECRSYVALAARTCPECGYQFPRRRARHGGTADASGILTSDALQAAERLIDVAYWRGIRLVREPHSDEMRAFPRRRLAADFLHKLTSYRHELLHLLETVPVQQVTMREYVSRRGFRSLQVRYWCEGRWLSEWVSLETGGRVGKLAAMWWRDRGGLRPTPTTVDQALARRAEIRRPSYITTAPNGKYRRITGWQA